jgi:hypothetical protein
MVTLRKSRLMQDSEDAISWLTLSIIQIMMQFCHHLSKVSKCRVKELKELSLMKSIHRLRQPGKWQPLKNDAKLQTEKEPAKRKLFQIYVPLYNLTIFNALFFMY